MVLKDGFYTALGTPIDEKGAIVEEGLRAQIEQQIQHGASGMLLMGSMGIQPSILTSEAARAAKIASDAVAGRTALFVGAAILFVGLTTRVVKNVIEAAVWLKEENDLTV